MHGKIGKFLNSLNILVILRVLMGWIFFYSGWTKTLTFFTSDANWSAASFLTNQIGPFSQFFTSLAGNVYIDYLNALGQLAIGIALILGIFVRPASFSAIFLMIMYYLAGFPPANAFLVDSHIIYILVLALLARNIVKGSIDKNSKAL